jgi:phage-related protein
MIFINILKSNIAVLGYMIAVLSNFIQWLKNVISWVGGVVRAIYGWTGLPGLVSNIFSSIRHNIVGNISGAIDTIWSFYGRFVDAGWGLIRAFANGIRGAFREAKDAVIGGLSDIRSYLPFSDAKKGPLSDLTLSGQRFSQTFAQGILNGSGYIANAVNKSLVNPSSAAGVNNSLGGNQSVSTSIYGNINIGNQQQSDQFFARLTRNQELASKNIATRVGAMG